MHHFERQDIEVADTEGMMLMDFVQLDGRYPGIAVLGKAIRQHFEHSLTCQRIGINIDFAKLAIGPDIVHATHVVVVSMGDKDAVNLPERLGHDLLAEVGTTVDEQPGLFRLDESRTAQALVVRVGTGAGIALATDGGYATRGSGS